MEEEHVSRRHQSREQKFRNKMEAMGSNPQEMAKEILKIHNELAGVNERLKYGQRRNSLISTIGFLLTLLLLVALYLK